MGTLGAIILAARSLINTPSVICEVFSCWHPHYEQVSLARAFYCSSPSVITCLSRIDRRLDGANMASATVLPTLSTYDVERAIQVVFAITH